MIFIGYIIAVLIGVALGLIGGGGSILTVPLLVYLFHVPPVDATSYSLFIVGVTSIVGAYNNYKSGHARITLALPLGIVSPATVFIVRHYWLPHIPDPIAAGTWIISKQTLTMVLFACLMLAAATSMLRDVKNSTTRTYQLKTMGDYLSLAVFAIAIGCVTGFLGAGGGFLIIPALVLFLKLPMKEAVGTSLFIIAINSLVGFLGDWGHYHIRWSFLSILTGLAVLGIVIGMRLSNKIAAHQLKKGFGWFVLLMGCYILLKELLVKHV